MPNLSTTKISSKGQVVIPEEIRKRLNLHSGMQFVVAWRNGRLQPHPGPNVSIPFQAIRSLRESEKVLDDEI